MADEVVLDYEDEMDENEDTNNPAPAAVSEPEKKQYHPPGLCHDAIPPNTADQVSFKDMELKAPLMRAVMDAGFFVPSTVQIACLPEANGGRDILCQAKSGTGKSAVFVLSTLQQLKEETVTKIGQPKVLVLAPTRELAFQLASEYMRFKKHMTNVRIGIFIGGLKVSEDCANLRKGLLHVAIGSPGRIKDLVEREALDLSGVEHFVLDECDKMLGGLDMRADIQWIFGRCPNKKQVLMFTATLPWDIMETAKKFMQNPLVKLVDDESKLVLQNLNQFYLPAREDEKTQKLLMILDMIEYDQVIIFVNTVQHCLLLTEMLHEQGVDCICINSDMEQNERLARFSQFKSYKAKVLVSTDLFGRGIDVISVNVVVNYECPHEDMTYLHRVARAGRYGRKGLAITFVANEEDREMLTAFMERFDATISKLPDTLDRNLYSEHGPGEEPETNPLHIP